MLPDSTILMLRGNLCRTVINTNIFTRWMVTEQTLRRPTKHKRFTCFLLQSHGWAVCFEIPHDKIDTNQLA